MPKPIRIKFLSKTKAEDIQALWSPLIPSIGFKNVEFTFDVSDQNYDFLAVYEGLPKWLDRKTLDRFEPLSCARSNTLLITTEPASIRIDGPHFMRQFGYILSNKSTKLIRHSNHIQQTPALRWFYGRPMDGQGDWLTVDQLSKSPPKKTADLSTVCSTKQMSHTIHAARLDFVMKLRERLKSLEVYGRGIRPISDKAEAMRDYRYHIAIENHIEPGHWTEKLADCFLAGCLPFYFGDPEYQKAFPHDSVIPIDIFNLEGSENIIRKAILEDEYTKRRKSLLEARHRVLTQYNILNWVSKFVTHTNLNLPSNERDRIYSRHAFRKKRPIKALSDLGFRTVAKFQPSAQPLQLKRPSSYQAN